MKFNSIAKVLTVGVLSLGVLFNTSHSENASAKENVRVAPITYVAKDSKGLYFNDYTVKDFEKMFLVSKAEVKKLKLKSVYKVNKPFIGYFKNDVKTSAIHEATQKKITRKDGKFVYTNSNKTIKLSKAQYEDLKGINNATVLIDKVNGKKVLKYDYSFVSKTYKYEVTKIDGNDVYGKPLNHVSKENDGIFLCKKMLGFKVKVGDTIAVKYNKYGDDFKSIKKVNK